MPALMDNKIDRSASSSQAFDYLSSSNGLVILVCDAALRFLAAADAANLAGNPPEVAANIANAQRILVELMGALDPSVAPDATEMLERVYQNLFDRLCDALDGDRHALADARIVLNRLRNVWLEATRTATSPTRGAFSCLIGQG